MKIRQWIAVGVAAWPGLAMADGLRVAVDIAPVHSLVAMVMEGAGSPDLIVPQNASPHAHSLRPSEARALEQAGVVVWVGPALTPWLESSVSTLSGAAMVLNLLDDPATQTLPFREGAEFEAHEDHDHDHSHGHDHAEEGAEARDPHVWLDPGNAIRWLPRIAQALSEADPANKDVYTLNAKEAVAELTELDAALSARLDQVKDSPFIVFHDAYHYFEARYDIEATGAIAASDAQAPSPRRLSEIRATIAATGAKCAFAEPGQSRDWINAVAPDIKVAELDPTGAGQQPGPDLYPAMLSALAGSLEACLSD